jgi:hypothetical protein
MKLLLTVTAVGLISAGAGAVVGYKIAERNLTVHFEERILKETAGMRVFYSQAKQPFDTPEEALAAMTDKTEEPDGEREQIAYHKIVKSEYEGTKPEDSSPVVEFAPPPVDAHVQNIFDTPIVIPEDEFHSQESGYMQGTLTYYVQDGALCDETDELIEALDETVGQKNMSQFGHMSTDENVVHIRNPRLQLEWEVIRNAGSYARDVQGMVDPPSGRGR